MTPSPHPPGVVRTARGHRFTLFAPHARRVELALRDARAPAAPAGIEALEREGGGVDARGWWSKEIADLPDEIEYTYRLDGGPDLIDPYARLLRGGEQWGDRAWRERGLPFRPYRSYFGAASTVAPRGSRPPRPAVAEGERVLYELHLRGFTKHPSSGVERPGTYLGLIEKIPYLRSLGVTTLELLPLFEFDETENSRRNPRSGELLLNYWGYSPITFFAPKRSYAAGSAPGAELAELVTLIDECHRAGMEVVLDVVYNHTAEGGGGATDPLRSLRGLAGDVYYVRDGATGRPFDCTGCGNTVNTNHPIVRAMILDSLRYWAGEVGVDGFRFDLAAVFFRGLHGEKLERSPIVEEIAADPLLAERLLIAEPWDVTGFSPPRGFPAPWRVWNGRFRDDLRRLVRGDEVAPRTLALRLGGSPDLAGSGAPEGAGGSRSIDFVTCHDGFTLEDLVSYTEKRNEENGENGEDGSNFNLSWNHGLEGPSDDPAVRALRDRQVANLLALLFLSRGTPMLLAGDERARTQRGNNNPWCQDNEISWIDWSADDRGRAAIVRALAALRREVAAPSFGRWARLAPFVSMSSAEESSAALAVMLLFRTDAETPTEIALAVNAGERAARLPMPRTAGERSWELVFDSQRVPAVWPKREDRLALARETAELELAPRSIRLLVAAN
jgi:glycogen operon protein